MITLNDAAEYIKTAKAKAGLLSFIALIKRIYTFTQERANRVSRFIKITRAYKSGIAIDKIVAEQGCSRTTVLRYARMAGLPKRPKHFPKEIRKAVIADYKAGVPIAKIAQLHNVSPAYVSKAATEEGISRNPPKHKR